MLGQSKISSFFSTPNMKRTAKEAEVDENPPSKISRPDSDTTTVNSPEEKQSLSPEQKEMIDKKRKDAQKKLLSKKGPQNFGLTWKIALSAEFEKEYFKKVKMMELYAFLRSFAWF